ncbi:polyunsaturated fatty acid lipoxygenase ALOX15B-like [Lepisosteus oculatus]|uniref:polyunsaturated fatty acid lipoxygenase ALOX15B-like n=1 Tax=Lepisosteus oculatus TaxID=7918 RepID=UPI0037138D3E
MGKRDALHREWWRVSSKWDPLIKAHRWGGLMLLSLRSFSSSRMETYKVTVTTGDMVHSGTFDRVFITLVGSEDRSERTVLSTEGQDLSSGMVLPARSESCPAHSNPLGCHLPQVMELAVSAPDPLGDLLFVRLDKEQGFFLPDDDWFCSKVEVTTPSGETVLFPCYRWVSDKWAVELREGKAKKVFEDQHPILIQQRTGELELCHNLYRWVEDWFLGYQCLNGCNPVVVQRCCQLPPNFPVPSCLVNPFLEAGSTLEKELLKGNIYLCDYKVLDGITPNLINNRLQYMVAPLCLLYKKTSDQLVPIAIQPEVQVWGNREIFFKRTKFNTPNSSCPDKVLIRCQFGLLLPTRLDRHHQLQQRAGPENPIFLPSDGIDWLLAKICVRSADFSHHQVVTHLLRTHLLAEVITMATLHHLPHVHPLYKLLIPHMRYTLQVNIMARVRLLGRDGVFSEHTAIGGIGLIEILERAVQSLTYSSLCLPEDISARGVESVPNYYYRDDGLCLWNSINRFVKGVVKVYYPDDNAVVKDTELQSWIKEIFTEGFQERPESEIPQSFTSPEEVTKFVNMVVFTVSAQHAAVNSGLFDFSSWMPNSPSSLQWPPPITKGSTTMSDILKALPDINTTVRLMATTWLLSKQPSDFVALGQYPWEHFIEDAPCRLILELQEDLAALSQKIKERNAQLELPYTYLLPELIENSIAL